MVKHKDLTPKEEIEVLERLSQKAASWMLCITARTLRDRAIPRSAAGRYSARDLVAHAVQRAVGAAGGCSPAETRQALDAERLRKLQIANAKAEGKLVPADTALETVLWAASGIRACGERLRREHGEPALAILTECLIELDGQCERERATVEAKKGARK